MAGSTQRNDRWNLMDTVRGGMPEEATFNHGDFVVADRAIEAGKDNPAMQAQCSR
jgi:hypothetical protein